MVQAIEPTAIIDGLALYKIGEGDPVFLMPYPHASGVKSMAENPLVDILNQMGRSVITFDPPGIFQSEREARIDLEEMLVCANEVLNHFKIEERIDLIGHSMSSFCGLAFSIEYPGKVDRLILVGSTSGWPAVQKWGVHKHWKWWRDKEYWNTRYLGIRIILGLGNLAVHKKLDHIIEYASFVDKQYVSELKIDKLDRKKPLPPRSDWFDYLRKERIDYSDNLSQLDHPVLICVGQYDPQTPLVMSMELNNGIRNSQLIVFPSSGHSPFIEKRDSFYRAVKQFLTN